MAIRILINSREKLCEKRRLFTTLLRHPVEKAADTPLDLDQMTGSDIAQPVVEKGVVEPFKRGRHVCCRFLLHSRALKPGMTSEP